MGIEQMDAVFYPGSIAVVGASENNHSLGYSYVEHLKAYGFRGDIYPVTPKYAHVLGIRAYPDLHDIPGPVDYVICCLPASKVPGLLARCGEKSVKIVHLFTGRFGETGDEAGADLEAAVFRLARKAGVRIIGPNCMGVYHPRAGMAFGYDFPVEPGGLALVFQSGGACAEYIYHGALRGLRFSKAVSYGNAVDVDESDLIDYLARDRDTKTIACYIEGVKDGRKFISTVKRAAAKKPVIVLKAGQSHAGARSAASHTSAMAGRADLWSGAARQAGLVSACSLEDMVDLAVAFSFLPPLKGNRVGVVGGGGGQSVLSADEWARAGFRLPPFSRDIRQAVKQHLPELWWKWLGNPVDVSVFPPAAFAGNLNEEIMRIMSTSGDYDLVVANFTLGAPRSKTHMAERLHHAARHIIAAKKAAANPIVAVLDPGMLGPASFQDQRYRCPAEIKEMLVSSGIPLFSTPGRAASAISRVGAYHAAAGKRRGDA